MQMHQDFSTSFLCDSDLLVHLTTLKTAIRLEDLDLFFRGGYINLHRDLTDPRRPPPRRPALINYSPTYARGAACQTQMFNRTLDSETTLVHYTTWPPHQKVRSPLKFFPSIRTRYIV